MGSKSSRDSSVGGTSFSVPVTLSNLNESPVMRAPCYANGLVSTYHPKILTVKDVLVSSAETFAENNCLGKRDPGMQDYTWWTYKQVLKMSERIGSAIVESKLFNRTSDLSGKVFSTVAILAKNSLEWGLLQWACSLYNLTIVALCASTAAQIIEECNLTTVFCTSEHVKQLKGFSNVKTLILMNEYVSDSCCCDSDGSDSEIETATESSSNSLHSNGSNQQQSHHQSIRFFKEILAEQESILPYPEIDPTDVCSIIYTSGTTTNSPKGAMITHANCIASLTPFQLNSKKNNGEFFIVPTDVYYSQLPLSHVYERDACLKVMAAGGSVGYASKELSQQKEDLEILKPTVYCSVPRLYNRIYQQIQEKLASLNPSIEKKFLEQVLAFKQGSEFVKSPVVDSLIKKKLKNTFGGRVRALFSGGAPLNHKVIQFLQVVLCVPILQGYGQTECNGVAFCMRIGGGSYESVGGPECNTEFKLLSCSELGYSAGHTDENGKLVPRGEILLRGGKVFCGYFNDPRLTSSKIDEEGWLHTGDIGQILPNGSLEIIDRRNNIFKLPIGEFVAPEKIEGIYLVEEFIQEIFVYGATDRNSLVAVIVPNFEAILMRVESDDDKEMREEGDERKQENEGSDEVADVELQMRVKEFIAKIEEANSRKSMYCEERRLLREKVSESLQLAEKDLLSYERIQQYEISLEPFANVNLITSTGKLRRKKAAEYFKEQINQMYSTHDTF